MSVLPTGSHTLTITSKTAGPFTSGFNASCSCDAWRYIPREYTRQEAHDVHDAHIQDVVNGQTYDALDAIATDAGIRGEK